MTKFFGWEDYRSCKADWEVTTKDNFPKESEILFASYGIDGYEGDAIVVFEHDGKVFENFGGHCSCYGLEDQWSPSETTWAALAAHKLDRESHDREAIAAFAEMVKQRNK